MGQPTGLCGIMARRSARTKPTMAANVQRTIWTPRVPSVSQPLIVVKTATAYPPATSRGMPQTTAANSSMSRNTSGRSHHPLGMISFSRASISASHWPTTASRLPHIRSQSSNESAKVCQRPCMTTASIGTTDEHTPRHKAKRMRLSHSRCLSLLSLRHRRIRSDSRSTCSAMSSRIRFRSFLRRSRSSRTLDSSASRTASRRRMRSQRFSLSMHARSLFLVSSSNLAVSLTSESCFLSV